MVLKINADSFKVHTHLICSCLKMISANYTIICHSDLHFQTKTCGKHIGAFPLQICAKLWRYFINVDKKVFRNDSVSINQCYATKTYPFASRDKSWQWILVRFDRFWIYLFKGVISVYL